MGPLKLILLIIFIRESSEEISDLGVVIRVTQNGFTYAANTVLEHLKKLNLSAFSIPSINITTSHVNYSIQNLTYTDYSDLDASVAIQESGLNVSIKTISVNAHGKIECRDKDTRNVQSCGLTMTISGSGNFLAYIGNTTKGRFDVWVKQEKDSCIIPPPNLTMKYTGCRKPEEALCAANSTELVEKIKKERFSEAEMCTLLRFYFFTRGNKEMNNINLTPRIGNTTFIGDLRLQEEPKYESRFVNFYHKGELLWYPTLEEYYNRKTVNYTLHNDSSKMVYIWISKDVVQNLFKGVQTHGMLCYTITPEKLGPGNPGLNISCSEGVCVGRLVPELEDKYPNQYMDLDIYSLETPNVTFEKNLAVLKFCAVMFIYIRNPMDKMPNRTVIAKLDGSLDIRIKIFMKDSLLCGEVVAFEPYLENVDTTIHDFDFQTVNFILTSAVVTTVEPMLNGLGRKGIPLPISDHIHLQNTTVDLIENAIVIGSDGRYNKTVD